MMQSCILKFRRLALIASVVGALGLVGCGHDNDSASASTSSTVSGTAATGAPIASGPTSIVGKNGEIATGTTGTDGKFSIDVSKLTFPAMIKVNAGSAGTFYSLAEGANSTVNVTPLTTLALVLMDTIPDDLGANYADWANKAAAVTHADLTEAIKQINANFKTLDTSGSGIDWNTYNFLTSSFNANGTGVDKTLDAFKWVFDFAKAVFAQIVVIQNPAGTTTFLFDDAISTAGINLGGTPGGGGGGGAGSGNIVASSSTPATGDATLNAPTITSEDAGGTSSLWRVTASQTVGGVPHTAQVYASKTDCSVTNVSHEWGAGATLTSAFDTAPTTTTYTAGTKTITFTNEILDTAFPGGTANLSTLNGTITLTTAISCGGGGGGATGLGAYAGTYNLTCASALPGSCNNGQTYVLTVTADGTATIDGHTGSGTPTRVDGTAPSETFVFGSAPPIFSVGFINKVPVDVNYAAVNGTSPILSTYTQPN